MTDTTRMLMAIYWVLRMRRGDQMSVREAWAFFDWMRSPENLHAFWSAWRQELAFRFTENMVFLVSRPEPNVIKMHPIDASSIEDAVRNAVKPRGRSRIARVAAVAAILMMSALLDTSTRTDYESLTKIVRTDAMEQYRMTLSDRTVVNLEERSELMLNCNEKQRVIYFRSGKGTFEVPAGLSSPCVVITEAFDLRAEPGSVFSVGIDPGVMANVFRGRVKATRHGEPDSGEAVTLEPGMVAEENKNGKGFSVIRPPRK